MSINIAVLGATGFTGELLVEFLLRHPKVKLTYLASRTTTAIPYALMFPKFNKRTSLDCEPLDAQLAVKRADAVFLALPHTASMDFVPVLLKHNKKVIDLSADYRISDLSVYEKYYKLAHKDKENVAKAVYGMSEIYHKQIAKANLVANPGCYPTSIILGLYPLMKEKLIEPKVIADSKSSISGAGKKATEEHQFMNVTNNMWAYKPFVHQHVPEMTQVLMSSTGADLNLTFTPHVIAVESGIFSTIYVQFKKKVTDQQIRAVYQKYYKTAPFVRIKENIPQLRDVTKTNFCDISIAVDSSGKQGIIFSCIDNLIKGAAGSAVQNLNIMYGWDETLGLV